MTLGWKLVIDRADPHRPAAFWSAALGYETEDNGALIERLLGFGAISEADPVRGEGLGGRAVAWRSLQAIRHPAGAVDPDSGMGLGRRILFQAVPEPRSVKNRLHIDVHTGPERRDAEVSRLERLGASVPRVVKEPSGSFVTMADPEGNEFDVQ